MRALSHTLVLVGSILAGTWHADAAAPCDGTTLTAAGAQRASALHARGAYTAPLGGPAEVMEVPVTFHVVRTSNGVGGVADGLLIAALEAANDAFAGAGIAFCRLSATHYIDSDAFYFGIDTAAEVDALRATGAVPDTINIYFTLNLATEAGPVCSVSSFSFNEVQGIVMDNECLTTFGGFTSLVHALGHYFDLFDTDETAFGVECVHRLNCDVAGDLVCDTPATPQDVNNHVHQCEYLGVLLGPCPGDGLYEPDITDFMTETTPVCPTSFTAGQNERALATLVNLRPELIGGCMPPAARYHVNGAAAPGGGGLSWATAFVDLQDAIDAAGSAREAIVEIWIAAGTYQPDRGTGDRNLSFDLSNGMQLYGGFAGFEESLEERDLVANETILSGDLLGDDVPGGELFHPSVFDNSFHVLTAFNTAEATLIDGLTITGGTALGAPAPHSTGGGIHLSSGTLTVRRCRFIENRAIQGGAISTTASSELFVSGSDFLGNLAEDGGGGLRGPASLDRCRFIGNGAFAGYGGAVYGAVELRSCLLAGNIAISGAALFSSSSGSLDGCTVAFNICTDEGGAVRRNSGTLSVANTILWGNATEGIVSEQTQISSLPEDVSLAYCAIQQLEDFSGPGLIGHDPLFVDASGADGVPGTLDDDLRLLTASPCMNRGRPGPNSESGELDLDGGERVQHCRIDMGAYESPLIARDCNGNGVDDACDLDSGTSPDCNGNDVPDSCDIADGREIDCNGNGVPDACDFAADTSLDCNANGIPDECDVQNGTSVDCNGNGQPDDCDIATSLQAASGPLGPLLAGWTHEFVVITAPPAIGPVVLELEGIGELDDSSDRVDVFIDGSLVGDLFGKHMECAPPEAPDLDQLVLPAAVFNAVAGVDGFTIEMVPRRAVTAACPGTFIAVTITYPVAALSDDLDGNGIPDECACAADIDGSGAVDVDDLIALIIAWGSTGGPADATGDGMVDVDDLVAVLTEWGTCR